MILGSLAACGDGSTKSADDADAGTPGAGDDAAVEDAGATPDLATVDATIEAFLKERGLKGATSIVLEREAGVVHQRGYGDFPEDGVFLLASASKILSAGVLNHLADEGIVDLDAPLSTYVPDWGDGKADITLAQLLSNSSGMLGLTEDATYAPYLCQYLATSTLAECGKTIFEADDAETRMPPDSVFRYGGAQWQLAGSIAQAASGKSWNELLDETYRTPCGVPSLGYANQFTKAFLEGGSSDAAFGYPDFFQGDPKNLDPTTNPNIEGGSYATTADYGQLLLMHLRGGMCGDKRALSEAAVKRMQTDRVKATYGQTLMLRELEGYGMGWFIDRDQAGLVVDPGAYGAMAWIDNDRGYAAFLVLEADSDTGHDLREMVTPLLAAYFDAR